MPGALLRSPAFPIARDRSMATTMRCSVAQAARNVAPSAGRALVARPAPFAGLRRACVVDRDVEACPSQQVGRIAVLASNS